MQLTSPAFQFNQSLPIDSAYKKGNVSPPLTISDVPDDSQSLALIVHDPDAPAQDWVHWLVWNIPPDTTAILEGQLPEGAVEGMTDYKQANWGGPAPPSGIHRYFFELYALDIPLNLPITAQREELEEAMTGHILEQTELIGTYSADN